MTDRPILYSAPMIRALLAGTKTQTRRVLQLPTKTASGGPIYERKDMGGWEPTTVGGAGCTLPDGAPTVEKVAIWHQTTGVCMTTPIQVGDRLWIREAWRTSTAYDDLAPSAMSGEEPIQYVADGAHQTWGYPAISKIGRLRPSMFLPRWASRLTQVVTDVRIQRLQDISEEDAQAEGIEDVTREIAPGDKSLRFWKRYRDGGWNGYVDNPIGSYASLWTEINGPGSWETNPWVSVTSFMTHHLNIDEMPAGEGR